MSEQRRKKKNYSSFPWAVFTAYMLAGAACGAVIMLHLERVYTSGEQTHVRMLRFFYGAQKREAGANPALYRSCMNAKPAS